MMCGRTENNRVVNFSGERGQIGHLLPVRITEALPNSLRGEPIQDYDNKRFQTSMVGF